MIKSETAYHSFNIIYHPGALASVKENWTCQQQQMYGFSATPCDQTMEQTFNRDSKTKGGITGFTLNRKAVQRWILSQAERGAITNQCYELAGFSKKRRLVFKCTFEMECNRIFFNGGFF